MVIPVFALGKGSLLYQEADFGIHFTGTSPNRPCTKNPLTQKYYQGIFFRHICQHI